MFWTHPVLYNIRCRVSVFNPKKPSSKAIYRRFEYLKTLTFNYLSVFFVILMDLKNGECFRMQYAY